jgi:hypothetical protein
MPSDKIAAVCVMHLMKHLFSQFVSDIRQFDDHLATTNVTEDKELEFAEKDLKIPAIQLFLELGKLFD